jgi:hypothetical protein
MTLARAGRLALALLAAAVLASPALADEPTTDRDAAVAAATRQAEQWVEAIDAHRYSDAWNQQAALVKEGRTEQDWISKFAGPREGLGKPVMRELARAEFSTRVGGAPPGEYVTVVYLTKFTNIPLAAETILLAREDGQWLIGGYSIADAEESPRPPDAASTTQSAPTPQPKTKD